MTVLFDIIVSLGLIVFQTIIRPSIPMLDGVYDLLTPFIVYLTLFRPVRETIPVVLILGFIMDNLSGGPFGLYLTAYLWLFICIKWMVGYLRVSNTLLLPLVIVAGVLVENLIFLGTIALLTPGSRFPKAALETVAEQLLWAVFTGAFLLAFLDYFWKRWKRWYRLRIAKEGVDE